MTSSKHTYDVAGATTQLAFAIVQLADAVGRHADVQQDLNRSMAEQLAKFGAPQPEGSEQVR